MEYNYEEVLERFKKYPKESVIKVVNSLSNKDKSSLFSNSAFAVAERHKIYQKILNKLQLMESSIPATLENLFSKHSKDDLEKVINEKLSEEDRELAKRYEANIKDNPTSLINENWTIEDNNRFHDVVMPTIKVKLDTLNVKVAVKKRIGGVKPVSPGLGVTKSVKTPLPKPSPVPIKRVQEETSEVTVSTINTKKFETVGSKSIKTGLTVIDGIDENLAAKISEDAKVDSSKLVMDLTDSESKALRKEVKKYITKVEKNESKQPIIEEVQDVRKTIEIPETTSILEDKDPKIEEQPEVKLNNNETKKRRGMKKLKKLTEKFPEYTIEEIREAAKMLSKAQQLALHVRYGENLDTVIEWTEETRKKYEKNVSNAIEKLKKILPNLKNLIEQKDKEVPKPIKPKYQPKKLTEQFPEYTLEEIREAAKTLSERQQRALYARYGENLDTIIDWDKETKQEHQKNLENALARLKKILPNFKKTTLSKEDTKQESINNIVEEKEEPVEEKTQTLEEKPNKTGYTYISDFSKVNQKSDEVKAKRINKLITELYDFLSVDELHSFISLLPKEEIEEVYKKYGKNLDEYNKYTKEQRIKRRPILNRALRHITLIILKEPMTKPGFKLKARFPNNTLEELKTALMTLDEEEQKSVYIQYGKNLDEYNELDEKTSNENNSILTRALNKLDNILDNKIKKNQKTTSKDKKLTSIFPEKTIEELKEIVDSLSPCCREAVYAHHGENLDTYKKLNKEETKKYGWNYGQAKKQIAQIIKEGPRKSKKLTSVFPGKTIEELKEIVEGLSPCCREAVYAHHGENLDTYKEFDKEESKKYGWNYGKAKRQIAQIINEEPTESKSLSTSILEVDSIESAMPEIEKLSEEEKEPINNQLDDFKKFIESLSDLESKDLSVKYEDNIKITVEHGNNKYEFELNLEDTKNIAAILLQILENDGNIEIIDQKDKVTYRNILQKEIKYIFPDNDLEDIKQAANELPQKQKDLFYNHFGMNLDECNKCKKEEQNLMHITIGNVKNILKGEKIRYAGMSLVEIFPNTPVEFLHSVVSVLPDAQKECAYKKYGKNLDEYNSSADVEISSSIYYSYSKKIIDKIQMFVDRDPSIFRIAHLITHRFPDNTIEEIKEAVKQLSLPQQKAIYARYGENLDTYIYWSQKEKNQYKTAFRNAIKNLEEILNVKTENRVEEPTITAIELRFPNNSMKEISTVIAGLNDIKQKRAMYLRYGQSLKEDNPLTEEQKKKYGLHLKLGLMNADSELNKINEAKIVKEEVKEEISIVEEVETKNEVISEDINTDSINIQEDIITPIEDITSDEVVKQEKNIEKSFVEESNVIQDTKETPVVEISEEEKMRMHEIAQNVFKGVDLVPIDADLMPSTKTKKSHKQKKKEKAKPVSDIQPITTEKKSPKTVVEISEPEVNKDKSAERQLLKQERIQALENRKQNIKAQAFDKFYPIYNSLISTEELTVIIDESVNAYKETDGLNIDIACNINIESAINLFLANKYRSTDDEDLKLNILLMIEDLYASKILLRYPGYSPSDISDILAETLEQYDGKQQFYIKAVVKLKKNKNR